MPVSGFLWLISDEILNNTILLGNKSACTSSCSQNYAYILKIHIIKAKKNASNIKIESVGIKYLIRENWDAN